MPTLVGQGSRLVGSVIRAANDTAPLVLDVRFAIILMPFAVKSNFLTTFTFSLLQGITEFTDQLPLIAGFASAYAEVNAEQTQKVGVATLLFREVN